LIVRPLPLGLVGCLWGFRAAPSFDGTDTAAPPPEPTLHGWSYTCVNGVPDVTTYAANVDLDAVGLTALIVESAADEPRWVEQHALEGGPVAWEVALESTDDPGAVRAGRKTVFTCDRVAGLTVVWRIYGLGGLADCVAVGDDPDGVLSDLGAYDWAADAAPTALGEVSDSDWTIAESTGGDWIGASMEIADVGGAGTADFVVGESALAVDGHVYLFLDPPMGVLLAEEADVVIQGAKSDHADIGLALAVGDVDGDSRADLLVQTSGDEPGGTLAFLLINPGW
jgi:hypothetical protein